MNILPTQKRTWAEIDVDAIRGNYRAIRERVGDVKICCTIKANGYGHGAVTLAKIYEEEGADFFAVSNIEEALQLRNGGAKLPILILGYTDTDCVELLDKYNLSQCVFSYDYAEKLSQKAVCSGVKIKVHFKIDTGMGRIGFSASDKDLILQATKFDGFIREGIFTHFASADEGLGGKEYTFGQFEKLCSVIDYLKDNGVEFSIRHCANSAGICEYRELHFDMVRAGIVLYGVQASSDVINRLNLKPALSFKTVVSHVKVLKKGESVSYGRTFTAKKDMVVATIPVGYADGLFRANSRRGMLVEIEGCTAPIIGRICMDQCMIDITDVKTAKVGSVVSIYGDKVYNCVDTIAKNNDTIDHEVFCAVGARVPRFYVEGGEIVSVENSICMR